MRSGCIGMSSMYMTEARKSIKFKMILLSARLMRFGIPCMGPPFPD